MLNRILKKALRVLGYSLAVLLTLLLLLWAALQFPTVQNRIADRATRYLSERISTPVAIDEIEIDFFNRLRLEGLYVEDLSGDTLLYAQAFEAQLGLFAPFQQEIHVQDFRLQNAVGKLYRGPDSLYNYQFIVDAFASESTDSSSGTPWSFGLRQGPPHTVPVKLSDSISQTQVYTRVGQFKGRINELDLASQQLDVERIDFGNSYAAVSTRSSPSLPDTSDTEPLAFPFTGWQLAAESIDLSGLAFSYQDFAQPPAKSGQFDPAHLNYEDINLKAQSFVWDSTALAFQLDQLSFRELNGFRLQSMSGSLRMSQQNIQLQDLQLRTDSSRLAPSQATLEYASFNELTDFVESVDMDIDLQEGQVQLSDIQYWSGPIPYLDQRRRTRFSVDGKARGRVNDLDISQLDVRADRSTHLRASGYIKGLPDLNQLTVDISVQELQSSQPSLKKLLRDVELPEGLAQLGAFQLQTRLKGGIDSLRAAPLRLQTSSATAFDGRLWASGLPDVKRLRFQLDIDSLKTAATDLEALAGAPIPLRLDTLGEFRYYGQVSGSAYSFSVKGELQTAAGQSTQNLRMAFNDDYSNAQYQGEVSVEQLALGALLDNPDLGTTSLQLSAKGEGLSLDSLRTQIDGAITALSYRQYEYEDIQLKGQLEGRQFDGQLDIEDPNLVFHFDGLANLNDSLPQFRFTARLDTANLRKLQLYDTPLHLRAKAEVQLTGGQIDQLEGQAKLLNVHLSNDTAAYNTDVIRLEARKQGDGSRQLALQSDIAQAEIKGQYELAKFSNAALDFVDTFFPIKRLMAADTASTDSLFLEPAFAKQSFDFHMELDRPTRLTKILLPALEQLDTAWISGSFRGQEKRLQLNGSIPALAYNGVYFNRIDLQAKGAPQELATQISARSLRSGGQRLAKRVQIDTRFFRDSLLSELAVVGDSIAKKLTINTLLSPTQGESIQMQLLPPFYLNGEAWNVPAQHWLRFGPDFIYANNVRLSKGDQAIYAQSQAAEKSAYRPLEVGFERFQIQELTKLANLDADYLSGLLQGNVQFEKQPDDDLKYTLNLAIDDLTVDKEPLGRLQVNAQPDQGGNFLKLNSQLSGAANDLRLAGTYGLEDGALDFDIDSEGLQLAPVDFFSLDNTKDSRGRVTADLQVKGRASAPMVTGQIGLDSASTFVEYLQTRFVVPQHRVKLSENALDIGRMALYDSKDRRATLSGRITHEQFNDIQLDLNFDAPSFLVLDTDAGDNELFYGKILVRADAQIRGPLELPNIDVTTTTLPGTDLSVLPLTEEKAIVREDFIIYGKPSEYRKDTSQQTPQIYQTNTTGYDLSLRLNLTPDAKITTIIDPATGDKLTAQGNANLLVEMDPSGRLTTTGTITLTSGKYSMNYEGVVKRSFQIQEGSTLYLPGDPLDARFNVTAVYQTETAVYPLIRNEAQSLDPAQEQAARRKQDIRVIMRMEGTLSAPDISFELETGSAVAGNIAEIVQEKFARLQQEENELNKQVFGLLLFNSFITSSGGGGDLATAGENIALSSVSSLVSSQLNRLASKYVEGVDINVGVDSYITDQTNTAVTEVELGVSKQLFDERLSVEVGGNLGVSESREQSTTAIAGNFLLEYKLTEDGRYRVRVFRRPDYDVFTDGIRTGASLIFKKSFGEIQPDTTQTSTERND